MVIGGINVNIKWEDFNLVFFRKLIIFCFGKKFLN